MIMVVDGSGSSVMEELLHARELVLVGHDPTNIKELILIVTWYYDTVEGNMFLGMIQNQHLRQPTMHIQVITIKNIRASRRNEQRKESVWKKPKYGFIGINVDATFD